jgi:hypothetical protein
MFPQTLACVAREKLLKLVRESHLETMPLTTR